MSRDIVMVGVPRPLHERLKSMAEHRRMTTRELVAGIIRDWMEVEDGWPMDDEEEGDEE